MFNKFISKTLIKNTAVYTITATINSAIPFLLLPILTRYLSPTDYGIVAMFQIALSVTSVLVGLNLYGAIGRQFFEKEEIDFPVYFTNCFYIVVFNTIVLQFIFVYLSSTIQRFTQIPEKWILLLPIVSFSMFINLSLLTIWQIEGNAKRYGIYQIITTITVIVLSILFVVHFGLGWKGRISAQFIAFCLFSIVSLLIINNKRLLLFNLNYDYIKHALSFGLPLVPHTFGGIAIAMTDRFLITNLVDIKETGIYMVGVQLGMIIGLINTSFNNAWVPWFFDKLKKTTNRLKAKLF